VKNTSTHKRFTFRRGKSYFSVTPMIRLGLFELAKLPGAEDSPGEEGKKGGGGDQEEEEEEEDEEEQEQDDDDDDDIGQTQEMPNFGDTDEEDDTAFRFEDGPAKKAKVDDPSSPTPAGEKEKNAAPPEEKEGN
jgi:hypothetical protein